VSKRCDAYWQEAHKAKGALVRCSVRATHLVVTVKGLHRMCSECADRWSNLRARTGINVLGVLPKQDRANPDVIKALRVRYALASRSEKR